jgi:predicted PurR-regulated permease PerM
MSRHLRPVDPSGEAAPDTPAPGPAPTVAPEGPRRSVRARIVGLQGYAVITIAVILVVAALREASGFFIPVAFSIVIALALAPVVRRLARLVPRWIASALVVTTAMVGIGAISYSLSDEAAQAIAGLPDATRVLRESLRTLVDRKGGPLAQLQRAATELQRTATENAERPTTPSGVTPVQVVAPPVDFNNFVWFGSQGVMAFLGGLALVAFLVYFLLASGDLFKRKFVRLSGERLSQRKVTVQMIDQIGARVAKAMLHLALAGALVAVCTWGLLTWFGVRYAGLWGIAAGLLNCVPYLGPAVVAAGLFFATLLQFGEITTALVIASVSLAVTTLESSLFTPVVFGRSIALNPVAVFVSFMFWGWLWGIPGMFLALPLLTIVKTVAESVEDLGALAELLSD